MRIAGLAGARAMHAVARYRYRCRYLAYCLEKRDLALARLKHRRLQRFDASH